MRIVNPLPQRYHTNAAGIGGRIKARPDDFLVEEVPLYEPEGAGEHLYLGIEKTNVAHGELISCLRRQFGVAESAIGFAGMKDKVGVTRQVVSVHTRNDPPATAIDHARIKVLWATRHRNKIRLGHLIGNRFSIRVREVDPMKAPLALQILHALEHRGVPNYFGAQRFGYRRNNHLIGAAFLLGDWSGMLTRLLGAGGGNYPLYQQPRRQLFDEGNYAAAAEQWTTADRAERIACSRLAAGKSPREACVAIGPTSLAFWISALQSAMFNRVLDQRLERSTLAELFEGDVAFKHASRSVFHVTAEDIASGELPARVQQLEISPSGPLWGRDMMPASGAAIEVECEALHAAGLTPELMMDSSRSPAGARRPLRIAVQDGTVDSGADHHGPYIRVAFQLPRGAYATVVMREIMKNDALDDEAAEE